MIAYSLLKWEVVIDSLRYSLNCFRLLSSLYGFRFLTASVEFDL